MTTAGQNRHKRWNEFRENAGSVAGKWFLRGTQGLLIKPLLDPVIENIFSHNETIRSFQENALDVIHNTTSPAGLLNFTSMAMFYVSSVITKKQGNNHKGFYVSNGLATGAFALLALSMAASGNEHSIPGTALNAMMSVWLTYNGYKKMKQEETTGTAQPKTLPRLQEETSPSKRPTVLQKFIQNARSFTKDYPNIIPGIVKVGFNGAALAGAIIDKDPMYVGIFGTWVMGNALIGISKQSHNKQQPRKPHKATNDNTKRPLVKTYKGLSF